MDSEKLRQITQLFLFTVHYKKIQWNYFPLPTTGSNDERWEEYPVKFQASNFNSLQDKYQCSCICSRTMYGKYCKPSILFVFRALFVLHFWNLTSELHRRKNLHFPFRSHIFVPTGRPNRCRIFLFNAFSNDSFLKWLKHYL